MPKLGQECLTCSRVLSIMVFFCFIIQYMLRINISIAITEMASKNTTSSSRHWTEGDRNAILSSFFFGYILFTVPGGRLSEVYGTKRVLGITTLVSSILTLVVPLAASLHQYAVVALRVLTGLALGVAFPSLPPLVSRWVPMKDRSKFISLASSASLGAVLTWPICGFLIAHLGWPSVFYVTGAIGILFSVVWLYLIHDSPSQHPRISKEELSILLKEVIVNTGVKHKVPWLKIFTSGPVWAIVVCTTCFLASWYFILTELPSYMKNVLDFNIKENGLLSSIPYIANYFASVVSCYFADKWIASKKFSIITTRRIFAAMTSLVPSFFFLIQSFWGYDRILSVVIFTLSVGFMGCYTSGFYSNTLDVAQAFSGTVFGIAVGCGSLAGFLAITLLGLIIKESQDFEHWRYIFWILTGVNLIGALFYFIFSSGELQDWNPKYVSKEVDKFDEYEEIKETCSA